MTEPQWLTYREAAERLGITADAVARRARRNKWPKMMPNRPGNPVRVQVPGDQLLLPPPAPPRPPALPPPPPPPEPTDTRLAETVAALEAKLAHLTEQAEQERRIAAIERRDRLEIQRRLEALSGELQAALRDAEKAKYAADLSGRGLVDAGRRIADLERQVEEARARLKKHERKWWKIF